MTSKSDPRLEGRYPEFARMSLRPGIGYAAGVAIGDTFTSKAGSGVLAQRRDVPGNVRIDGKRHPMGRYIRRAARAAAGLGEAVDPDLVRERALAYQTAMSIQELRDAFAVRREVDSQKLEAEFKSRPLKSKRRI